jgi:hypothetical protein
MINITISAVLSDTLFLIGINMWRKLTIMLFLLVLAQTASALPSSQVSNLEINIVLSNVVPASSVDIESDVPKQLFNLPSLQRSIPSIFAAEIQTSPNYVLLRFFFESELSAALFKNLTNPPLIPTWFDQLSQKKHSSRLSGWKDGNTLYTSVITYHC